MWSNYSLLNYNGSGCGVPPNPCGSPACPNCSDGHTYSLTVELDEPVASSTLILANPEDIATYGELIDVIHVALGACNPRIIDLLDEPNNNNDKIRFTSSSIGDTSTADINIDGIWDMFEELNSGPQDILSDRALRNHGKNPSTDEGFVAPGGPYIKTYTGAPDEWVIFDSSIPQPELYNALGSPLPVDENDLPVDCG